MKSRLITPKLITTAILFFTAVFIFEQIETSYFRPAHPVNHIIDSHLMPDCGDSTFNIYRERFFDQAYVREAAKLYEPPAYMRSFFILDFFFPFIYSAFFLAMATYWKGTNFYRILKPLVVTCALFDLSENASFAYFLYHQDGNMNIVVSVFTTLKSILFFLGMIISLFAFVASLFSGLRK